MFYKKYQPLLLIIPFFYLRKLFGFFAVTKKNITHNNLKNVPILFAQTLCLFAVKKTWCHNIQSLTI
jgi:hypothetical protein